MGSAEAVKAEKSLRKWMKSEAELKPRQVAVAAFYVEPTTPGEDRRWEEGAALFPTCVQGLSTSNSICVEGRGGLCPF